MAWTWNRRKWDVVLRDLLFRLATRSTNAPLVNMWEREAICCQADASPKYDACLKEIQRLFDETHKDIWGLDRTE